jgi:hypothetical protein
MTPSTLVTGGGGGKFGDDEPGMHHSMQEDWSGGRGAELWSDDPTRYFDAKNCWTLTPNYLLPGPSIEVTRNDNLSYAYWPGMNDDLHHHVAWYSFVSSANRYVSSPIVPGSFTADYALMMIRRVGSPATLTFEIRTDDGAGKPSTTVLQTVTKTIATITDFVAEIVKFDWSSTQAFSAATTYHLVVYGASTDNIYNHWEIATDKSGAQGGRSSNGTTWSGGATQPYYRLAVAGDATLTFFELDGALYAVDRNLDGSTATNLYLNGARGKATSGASTTLTDTNQAMTSNEHLDAKIRIINGTGKGQIRTISSNTATAFTVSPAWNVTPSTDSEYVVYDSHTWRAVTGHGFGNATVKSVVVVGGLAGTAYFAQGSGTNMRRMRFNAGAAPPAHEFAADGTNTADLLMVFPAGHQVYRVTSKNLVSGAALETSLGTPITWGTDLSFTVPPAFSVGTSEYAITKMVESNGSIFIIKEDSIWSYSGRNYTETSKVDVGLDSSPHPNNGIAAESLNKFLFFSYMHSIERLYGETLDDIGPWRGAGIPAGRTGVISCMTKAFGWLFVGVDAGTSGTSCVLVYDGRGYHEIFRAPAAGMRVRSIYWQSNPDGRPILWVECGRLMWLVRFPKDTLNPLSNDGGTTSTSFHYNHEGVLITSIFDMGKWRLPKLWKELTFLTRNLASGIEVKVDYQKDEEIGSTTWTHMGAANISPEDTIPISLGNARQIRFRYRIITNTSTAPPVIRATDLEGFGRTPLKYQYLLKAQVGHPRGTLKGDPDHDPDEIDSFLKSAAAGAEKIIMRSIWKRFDRVIVQVEPPTCDMLTTDTQEKQWSGLYTLALRLV